jgi:hypothetical protein
VFYGFGDASGNGLGSGIVRSDKSKLSVRIRGWGYAKSIEESSNWREFMNVVEGLEEETHKGMLTNCIVFFFLLTTLQLKLLSTQGHPVSPVQRNYLV